MATFTKDPDAELDYVVDWSSWLTAADGDTIQASSWVVPDGLELVSQSNTTTAATIWLKGGTLRQTYQVTNRITTAAGRTDDRTILLFVLDR